MIAEQLEEIIAADVVELYDLIDVAKRVHLCVGGKTIRLRKKQARSLVDQDAELIWSQSGSDGDIWLLAVSRDYTILGQGG